MMLTEEAMRRRLRAVVAGSKDQKTAARALGVSPQYLCEVLLGRRPAGPKLLRGIGLQRRVTYVPVEKR
jgi:hypothetical protein